MFKREGGYISDPHHKEQRGRGIVKLLVALADGGLQAVPREERIRLRGRHSLKGGGGREGDGH